MARRGKQLWTVGLALLMTAACGGGGGTVVHNASTLTGQNYWQAGTHVVNGDITITDGTLNIASGATVKMGAGVNIIVTDGGSLAVNGSATGAVTIVPQNSGSPWGSIAIDQNAASNSAIQYAKISGGGKTYGALYVAGNALSLSSTSVTQSATYGVQLYGYGTLSDFSGNDLSGNQVGPVYTDADSAATLSAAGSGSNTYGNVIVVADSTLHSDATWLDVGQPYLLGSLILSSGDATVSAQLTAGPGVTLMVASGGGIQVDQSASGNGGVAFVGTANAPVTLTSSAATPKAGDWSSLIFAGAGTASEATQVQSSMTYTRISYGGGVNQSNVAQDGAVQVLANGWVSLINVDIDYSASNGLSLADGGIAYNDVQSTASFTGNALYGAVVTPAAMEAFTNGAVTVIDATGAAGYVDITGGTLTQDANWWGSTGVGFVLEDDLTVGGATGEAYELALNPPMALYLRSGVNMLFKNGSNFYTTGTSASNNVFITAAKASEAWGYISLTGNSSLSYTNISYGGGEGYYGQVVLVSGTTQLYNVNFSSSTAVYSSQANRPCDYAARGGQASLAGPVSGQGC